MKRLLTSLAALVLILSASAVERSTTIVYINGTKYFVHHVAEGDSLAALAATYATTEDDIRRSNPSMGELVAGATLRIPVPETAAERTPERKLRKSYDFHTVAKGETLYAISRRYEIPIDVIMEDNPEIDPIRLKPDQRILIRKKEMGSESEVESIASWEEYRNTLNSVAESGYRYYIVKKGETVYGLARRFNITEEEFSELNGGIKPNELRAGAMVKVPFERFSASAELSPADSLGADSLESAYEIPDVEFRPLLRSERLKVALLLPLTTANNRPSESFLDFYQGFLMGLDSVKLMGYNVELNLYNTARDSAQIRRTIASPEFEGTHLIVGPVYEEDLEPVVRYAEKHSIPVVSPLANLGRTDSDVVFQLSADPAHKYDKVTDLFGEEKSVTLIYGAGTDEHFEQEILAALGTKSYKSHTYKYAHPSAKSSASDLTPLLSNTDDNVFVVMSNNEVEVDRILAGIASAYTNISARTGRTPKFTVLANNRWTRYQNLDRELFFADRLVVLANYHAKRDSHVIRSFDRRYIRTFGALPSLFSYRGYDVAMIFCPAMFGDIQYDLEGRRFMPLQTTYIFKREGDKRNHVNRNWTRADYDRNFTITVQ